MIEIMCTKKVIDSFTGEHSFLSNFYPAGFKFDGMWCATSEHAYQARKTADPKWQKVVLNCSTPGLAKRTGKKVPMRPDWNHIKDSVMRRVLRAKFDAHVDLKEKLLHTGDSRLVEGNTWGDKYWGVCDGEGKNKLGVMLMELRAEYGGSKDPAALF